MISLRSICVLPVFQIKKCWKYFGEVFKTRKETKQRPQTHTWHTRSIIFEYIRKCFPHGVANFSGCDYTWKKKLLWRRGDWFLFFLKMCEGVCVISSITRRCRLVVLVEWRKVVQTESKMLWILFLFCNFYFLLEWNFFLIQSVVFVNSFSVVFTFFLQKPPFPWLFSRTLNEKTKRKKW